jgi:probable rRNA maturation factor
VSAGPRVAVDERRKSDDDADEPPSDREALAELLSAVLRSEGVGAQAEAGLLLVDPEEMAHLNAEHLGGSGPTDVLSFPLDGVGDGVGWMVGDVVVCPEVAVVQAGDHAGSAEDELRLLVVHGGLHLCGWDHAEAGERRAMWARERELMVMLGCVPSRDPWGAP